MIAWLPWICIWLIDHLVFGTFSQRPAKVESESIQWIEMFEKVIEMKCKLYHNF